MEGSGGFLFLSLLSCILGYEVGMVEVGREVLRISCLFTRFQDQGGPYGSRQGAGDYRRTHIMDASVRPCHLT